MSGTWPSPSVAVRFTPVALHVCFFPMRAPYASVSESKSNQRGLAVKLRAQSPSARVGAASRDAGFLLFERARSVLGKDGGNPYTVRKSVARKFKIWKRTGKLWDTLTIRRPSDRIGFGRSSSGKSQKLRRLHVSRDVCPCFGIQECTTKLFGSPDSDASPHLSLALAFPLPASGDRRPLRSPTRGAG